MKAKLLSIFCLVVLFVVPVSVFAQNNLRSSEVVTLNRDETIDQDFFASGEKVIISGTVNGDAYVAGGSVIIDGTINGDLLLASGNANVGGTVNGDIRAVGGNINISANTQGSLTVVGGSINVSESANIAKSVVIAGGNAQIFAPVGRGVSVATGALTLGSRVGSGVIAAVGDVTLTPNAQINGDLTYYSDREAHISPEASLSGQITRRYIPRQTRPAPDAEDVFTGIKSAFTIAGFVSSLIVGLLLLFLVPNFTRQVTETIAAKPLLSIGVGLLVLILAPILIIILFIILVGIPLALILLAAYLIIMYIGSIFVALFIGQKVLQNSTFKNNLFLSFFIGLIILTSLNFIPIIGQITQFIVMLLGVGAYLITKRNVYQSLKSKKII